MGLTIIFFGIGFWLACLIIQARLRRYIVSEKKRQRMVDTFKRMAERN
jgi:hypothetical protein